MITKLKEVSLMAEPETRSNSFGAALIDEGFNFRALSNSFRSVIGCPDETVSEPDAVFGHVPGLRDWLSAAIASRADASFNGESFCLTFLPMNVQDSSAPEGAYTSFYLIASRSTPPAGMNTERVRRLQHDIKNQLGGLKLYTNFLKKRLADDTELIEIIDKMNNIVGAITQQVAQIRQEEGQ
jgi:hypothetical protein